MKCENVKQSYLVGLFVKPVTEGLRTSIFFIQAPKFLMFFVATSFFWGPIPPPSFPTIPWNTRILQSLVYMLCLAQWFPKHKKQLEHLLKTQVTTQSTLKFLLSEYEADPMHMYMYFKQLPKGLYVPTSLGSITLGHLICPSDLKKIYRLVISKLQIQPRHLLHIFLFYIIASVSPRCPLSKTDLLIIYPVFTSLSVLLFPADDTKIYLVAQPKNLVAIIDTSLTPNTQTITWHPNHHQDPRIRPPKHMSPSSFIFLHLYCHPPGNRPTISC